MAYAGIGIREALSTIRVERAAELLSTTTLSMKQIAWMVGYSHASTFDREFRKHHAETPSAFRETALFERPERLRVPATPDATSLGHRLPEHDGRGTSLPQTLPSLQRPQK